MPIAGLALNRELLHLIIRCMLTVEARSITAPPTVFTKGSITFHYGSKSRVRFFIYIIH